MTRWRAIAPAIPALVVGSLLWSEFTGPASGQDGGAAPEEWRQTEFVLGTFWDPCISGVDSIDARRFRTAREAGFNLLTGTQDPDFLDHSEPEMRRALALASQFELRYLVSDFRFHERAETIPTFTRKRAEGVIEAYGSLPPALARAHYGYHLSDEPILEDLPAIKDWVELFRTRDPSRATYVNLPPASLYGKLDDVKYYLKHALLDPDPNRRPNLISFDNYPFRPDGKSTRYFLNLTLLRERADGRPIWAIPLITAWSERVRPDESQIRFMTYAPLAYAVKGLVFFSYEQLGIAPRDDHRFSDAPIRNCDEIRPLYYTVQRINRHVGETSGPMIMRSWHLDVAHTSSSFGKEEISPHLLVHPNRRTPVVQVAGGAFVVGTFRDTSSTGQISLLLVNQDLEARTARLVLKGDQRSTWRTAARVWPESSSSAPVVQYEASTHRSTVEVPLAGGEGRLFHLDDVRAAALPRTTHDFDGDGRADRLDPNRSGPWRIDFSSNGLGEWDSDCRGYRYGGRTVTPTTADFDGDGREDLAFVTRSGTWHVDLAWRGFGIATDKFDVPAEFGGTPYPGDYDGDGRADLCAVAGDGWWIDYARNGFGRPEVVVARSEGGLPAPADYDGDGIVDMAFCSATEGWSIDWARNGFGDRDEVVATPGPDVSFAVPADYDGDFRIDLGEIDAAGVWRVDYAVDGFGAWNVERSGPLRADERPVAFDYDGDGKADMAVRGAGGGLRIDFAANGFGSFDRSLPSRGSD